jgi:4-hydroxybenzoate polyprenyltransferase
MLLILPTQKDAASNLGRFKSTDHADEYGQHCQRVAKATELKRQPVPRCAGWLFLVDERSVRRPVVTTTATRTPVLCVDLDRALLRSDVLWELIALSLAKNPLSIIPLVARLPRGRSRLRLELAERFSADFSLVPHNTEIVELVRSARERGAATVLVTDLSEVHARRVADSITDFDTVFTVQPEPGVGTPQRRARQLVAAYGEQGFDYAGASRRDLDVWQHANKAIAVGAGTSVMERLASLGVAHERITTPPSSLGVWMKQLRVHQWTKNVLVFVPLLVTLRQRDLTDLANSALIFAAFCLMASAVYIFNDLSDLGSDRAHPRKQFRPLASGAISIPRALLAATALAAGSLALASLINVMAVGILLLYAAVTAAYSIYIKKVAIADVIVLAGLYTARVAAGCAALRVYPSIWLLLFSVFIFFSLALMKRCADITQRGEAMIRRGYIAADRSILITLGVTSGVASVMAFCLYVSHQVEGAQFVEPWMLWLIVPLLLLWIARVWLLTNRGDMQDDPVTFALSDRISIVIGISVVLIVLAAALI